MKDRYIVRDREAGNVIVMCETFEEAQDYLNDFEQQDKNENNFTENFYEIYDSQEQ